MWSRAATPTLRGMYGAVAAPAAAGAPVATPGVTGVPEAVAIGLLAGTSAMSQCRPAARQAVWVGTVAADTEAVVVDTGVREVEVAVAAACSVPAIFAWCCFR